MKIKKDKNNCFLYLPKLNFGIIRSGLAVFYHSYGVIFLKMCVSQNLRLLGSFEFTTSSTIAVMCCVGDLKRRCCRRRAIKCCAADIIHARGVRSSFN